MNNPYGIIAVIFYMLANGLLSIFQMYKNTNEKDVVSYYNNKIIRKLSKLSGYMIIALLLVIIIIYGFIIGLIIFLIGFLGQKFYNIIVHYIVVVPINKIFYKK